MMTFNVPDPMIHKMRLFFVDLNIKSRGLITNSFIMTNQPHPQPQQQTVANNSHLRNALLQGALPQPQQQTQQQSQQQSQQPQLQQHQLTTGTIEDSVLKELPAASPTPCLQGQIVGSTTTPLKAKLVAGSTLSSSHATLTALLNNGGAGVAVGVGVGVGVAPVVNPAPKDSHLVALPAPKPVEVPLSKFGSLTVAKVMLADISIRNNVLRLGATNLTQAKSKSKSNLLDTLIRTLHANL
ncbi:GL22466 [Drosophila persimilis]|uniref:GL22466 n=1 Tax=Drosophila persimilis TaxID=7234 RepID=B4H1J2_DROPE|nr:GL22466 [Drosophila persimilis]